MLRLSFHAHHSPSTATLPAGRFFLDGRTVAAKFFIRFPIGCSGRSSKKPPSPPPSVSRSGRRSGSRRRQILEIAGRPGMANARCLGPPLFFWQAGSATSFSGDSECFPNVQIEYRADLPQGKARTRPLLRLSFGIQQKLSSREIAAWSRELGRGPISAQFSKHSPARCSRRSRFKRVVNPSACARSGW